MEKFKIKKVGRQKCTFSLKKSVKDALRKFSKKTGVAQGHIIEKLIETYLK